MPENPIDLDALVDILVQEQTNGKHPAAAESAAVSSDVSAAAEAQDASQPPIEQTRETEKPDETVSLPHTEEAEPPEEPTRIRKQRRRKGRRRREPEVAVEEWADWGLDPLGTRSDAIRMPHTAVSESSDSVTAAEDNSTLVTAVEEPDSFSGAEEFPPVHTETKQTEAAAESGRENLTPTRVIPALHTAAEKAEPSEVQPDLIPDSAPAADTPVEVSEPADAMPDQLSLEELVRVETVDNTEEQPENDPEELLRQTREEKIRDFVLAGEEETNEPEEEPELPEEEPEEIEDFTSYDEAKAVRLELRYRRRMAGLSFLLSALLAAAALGLALLTIVDIAPIPDMGYLTVQAFVLVLLAVLNYPAVVRGVTGLASLQANSDSGMSVALLFSIGSTIARFFNSGAALPVFPALSGLTAVAAAAAHYIESVRVEHNFAFISYPGEKYAAALIQDPADLQEIGRRVSMDGETQVAYFHPTAFLSGYLEHSAEENDGDRSARWRTPLLVVLSLAIPTVCLLTGWLKGAFNWLEACGYLLCLSAVPVGLVTQISLRRCSDRMLQKGGFLVGYEAVRMFGSPDGITLDLADLYPDESMLLHGIKTFSGMHIDEAIVDAASLSIRAGGPLSCIFRRIIENKPELLSDVDSLVYEQGMGLSGWVNGRRVLVGNRRLLQNHGVDVPSMDYEARYARDGRQLVYLSTAGELSAMFVISYQPDEEIREALQQLCRAKVTLLLRSCDPNITAESVCRDFDLDEYYVDVLPTPAGRIAERLMSEKCEEAPALLASNGHILGTAMALSVCRSLQIKCRMAQGVGAAASVIGLLLGALWALKGLSGYAISALVYMVISAMITMAAPLFRRIG